MKKMIIAATLAIGFSTMSFAQAPLAKNNADHRPSKMSITKKDKPAPTTTTVTPVAKTNSAVPGKSAGSAVKTSKKAAGTSVKTTGAAPVHNNKMIGKKNKAAKKLKKANKKAAKPVKTAQ